MGKKRKHEVDLDAEKTLYTSFVSAANSVSQLYTQAAQQARKGSSAASRHTLERVICHLLRECNGGDNISKTALLHFLQQEYEGLDGCDGAAHQFPVHFLPNLGATSQGSMEDACETASKQRASMGSSPCVPSPARRNQQFGHNSGGAMDLSQSSGTHQTGEMCGAATANFMNGNLIGADFQQQQQQQQSTQAHVQYLGQPMYGQLPDGRGYAQQ